ncbi:MAG: hypothetical protein P4L46_05950 [Fimbriimonas sp.]|nr:hypothetical protein [Fimbriimonas sp.]
MSIDPTGPSGVFPGADERTPSRSQYFSWINNTNEGATEGQTRANLAFFEWLKDEYGMQLDIYAFDAGAIDGASCYGSTDSERFKRQFPRGFGPLAHLAGRMGSRLGIWCGPDGFGDTDEEAETRIETMVSLCRDHGFALFKMDAVCGNLRPNKRGKFIRMMSECRRYSPDLILLNHRLDLGEGLPHATTFLFEGAETYIDVHMANRKTATHSRAVALERGLVPGLQRLTEDHGVCLSSCLDHWEDDLVLQAFNRCLILAPELYGNPWLLRDDEYPRLARIFNLHRRYRDILVDGIELPKAAFGPLAVSRGNASTRLLTLRNLTWEPATHRVPLDSTVGLEDNGATVHVRRYHPHERIYGNYVFGDSVEIEVSPFRSLLLLVTNVPVDEPGVVGCDYDVIRDVPDHDLQVRLLGAPGTTADVTLPNGKTTTIDFEGDPLKEPWHRKIGDLAEVPLPEDARALYEATCFAADNNALECRELERSGPTEIGAVQSARDAFFGQPVLRRRYLTDRNLFDDDPETAFSTSRRWGDVRIQGGSFRLDLGRPTNIDRLVLEVGDDYDLQPLKSEEGVWGSVSEDLRTWLPQQFWCSDQITAEIRGDRPIRYVTINRCPDRIRHVRGYLGGKALDRTGWRASNLFASSEMAPFARAWAHDFEVTEAPLGSYLAIAIEGVHGVEKAYAALRVGAGYAGAPRRSPSFPSNTWECPVATTDRNTTYFIPLTKEMIGQPLQAVVLLLGHRKYPWDPASVPEIELVPKVWVTAYPNPHSAVNVVLGR